MDVSTITPEFAAAFATSYAQLQSEVAKLKCELEEKDAEIAIALGEARVQVLDGVVEGKETNLTIAGMSYCFPSDVEKNERAVWRNVEFSKHLRSHGLGGKLVPTSYVIDWFKKQWFGDERRGDERLKSAGFTREQLNSLTVHHIVARRLGGGNSIYNYHIMLNNVNSHFGSFFSKEMVAFVGSDNAEIACRVTRRLTSHAAMDDSYNENKFDPYAVECSRRPLKRAGQDLEALEELLSDFFRKLEIARSHESKNAAPVL